MRSDPCSGGSSGGGSGLGKFGRVYSANFETSEDCEQQCEYVTGEAQAVCKVWQYRLWSFKGRNTKLERFLAKNQDSQKKSLNFESWSSGKLSKVGHDFRK